jgi:hypothetical protein
MNRAAKATMLAMKYGLGLEKYPSKSIVEEIPIKKLGNRILIKRWQNKDYTCWLELYRQDVNGIEAYCFSSYRGGGNMGCMTLAYALTAMEERLRAFHMDGDDLNFGN